MQIVPLQSIPNQTLQIILNGQSCQLNVYQAPTAMFIDVYVNGEPIRVGSICQNLNLIIRHLYLGFIGDFVFADTQGTSDPSYDGLGSRFQLAYLTATEAGDT